MCTCVCVCVCVFLCVCVCVWGPSAFPWGGVSGRRPLIRARGVPSGGILHLGALVWASWFGISLSVSLSVCVCLSVCLSVSTNEIQFIKEFPLFSFVRNFEEIIFFKIWQDFYPEFFLFPHFDNHHFSFTPTFFYPHFFYLHLFSGWGG